MDDHDIRLAIDDALLSYCRGIDRLDEALVTAAFHPGAELVDYGPDALTIEVFVEHALGSLRSRFVATQHRLSNVSIEIDGDAATVEAYVLAFHVEPDGGALRLHTFNGRYIDRFEGRDGSWKIARRTLRNDWSSVEPITAPMSGTWVASGRGGTPDPIED